MQDLMEVLRDRQRAGAGQAPVTVGEARATFAPAGPLHPVPDDVLVSEVSAGGVRAHWLAAPGADADRVLLFLHGGGYELGSLRSDGELAASWAGPAGCACCSLNIDSHPSIPSRPPSTTSGLCGGGSALTSSRGQDPWRWPSTRPGEASPWLCSWRRVTRGTHCLRPPY